MDVAVYNERIMGQAHVENVADLALPVRALAYRGVAHITFPADIQEMDGDDALGRGTGPTTPPMSCPAARWSPPEDQPTGGRSPQRGQQDGAILAGPGALDAGDELEQIAELLGAPIVKALLGKAPCPTTARTPPAGSACSAPRRRRKRWRSATRC